MSDEIIPCSICGCRGNGECQDPVKLELTNTARGCGLHPVFLTCPCCEQARRSQAQKKPPTGVNRKGASCMGE